MFGGNQADGVIGVFVIAASLLVGLFIYIARMLVVGVLQTTRAVIDTAVFSCSSLSLYEQLDVIGITARRL